jgi:hypothetical protein
MNYILDRICEKYKKEQDPTFSQQEIKERLKGLGPDYVGLNIRHLFKGSGVIDIDDEYNLTLNGKGKEDCRKGELLV